MSVQLDPYVPSTNPVASLARAKAFGEGNAQKARRSGLSPAELARREALYAKLAELRAVVDSDPEGMERWVSLYPERAAQFLRTSKEARKELARLDPSAFVEYVGRNEASGAPLRQAPLHREFQDLLTNNDRTVLWSAIEHGKSFQISVLRVLWELGRNPNLRVVLVSNTQKMAEKWIRAQQEYLTGGKEGAEALREVFPNLQPGKVWTGSAYKVVRQVVSKDFSVQAIGVHGALLGARTDLLILDDVLDYENTRTPEQRENLKRWVRATLFGRLTAGARVMCVGTAWTPDDLMHDLSVGDGWVAARFPAINEETGEPAWPAQWPKERIEERAKLLGPVEAPRQLFCKGRSDAESRFREEWLRGCLVRGEGRRLAHALSAVPPGYRIVTGVDLGTRESKRSDRTVLFTIALHPDQTREVLGLESGQWEAPEIIRRILDVQRRYQSVVIVESNAAQDFIRQFLVSKRAIPIWPFQTGKNKHSPEWGVESLAVEMANTKWIIPARGGLPATPELDAWVKEMLFYDPNGHTGDRLMASWFAREGARMRANKGQAQRGNLSLNRR